METEMQFRLVLAQNTHGIMALKCDAVYGVYV